jgi:hypothetical protein
VVVLPQGFHRIRYYGLLTRPIRANNIARIRALLAAPLIPIDAIKAATTKPEELKAPKHPCPCCGCPMRIIETFLPGQQPKYRPTSSEDPDRHLTMSISEPSPRKPFSFLLVPQPATAQVAPMLPSPIYGPHITRTHRARPAPLSSPLNRPSLLTSAGPAHQPPNTCSFSVSSLGGFQTPAAVGMFVTAGVRETFTIAAIQRRFLARGTFV